MATATAPSGGYDITQALSSGYDITQHITQAWNSFQRTTNQFFNLPCPWLPKNHNQF